MQPPTISYLTDIWFEPDALRLLPDVLHRWRIARPLVVTDEGLRQRGFVERLGFTPAAVFADTPANPTEAAVLAALTVYHEQRCDGILALGGGSPIDCAKAVSLLVTHSPPLERYAFIRGGLEHITADKPPVIAIPTTAGTGSEVGRAALITLESGRKLALISGHLIPQAAICDPVLTRDLPPHLTAATGMDAISHCVETFCSPRFNPVAEAIALDGLVRAVRHIRAAVADGSNLVVRGEMLMAALQGGLTFQKGLGAVHSLSHPLGALARHQLHHGTLNAIFLPHVLRFNCPACPDKLDRMAAAIGLGERDQLPQFFRQLVSDIGLPTRLRKLGLQPSDLTPLPQHALEDHCTLTNPRSLGVEDLRRLYEEAF